MAAVGIVLCVVSAAQAQIIAESRFNEAPQCASGCPGAPSCINFVGGEGLDGWFFDPSEENFAFWATAGSPTPLCGDGYLRYIDPSPTNEGVVFCDRFNPSPNPQTTPPLCQQKKFLGNWSDRDEVGHLCFDFRIF